jgi:hypothetical protein
LILVSAKFKFSQKPKAMTNESNEQINQPVSKDWDSQDEPNVKERNLTANPGDRIADEPQSIEEKAKQVAVDSPDITGDHITVPTYFVVDEPNGEKKALHHVKDAEEISDVIRQARVDENGNRIWW